MSELRDVVAIIFKNCFIPRRKHA